MRFRCISSKSLLLRLSSSASGGTQPSSQVPIVTRFFTSSSSSGSAGSSLSAGYSSLRCFQPGEESQNVKVSVWWNLEDCDLPAGTDWLKAARAITAAIRSSGIDGPIFISAYGDVSQLSIINRKALSSMGVNLNHVPQDGETSAKMELRTELGVWTIKNPPPAHIFVISNDDLASTLHILRNFNFNILLASKANAPGVLCSAATIMWDWYPLVKGENVTGRHFNQPPDGPWYGHYRIPLQDPFAVIQQESLWRDIELFINSPGGATIISHSKAREEMARNLQKEGPSCLKPLSELDMLHLVYALIVEKKWVEESPSVTLPFRVSGITKKCSDSSHSCTGLRPILDPPKSRSRKKDEKRSQNTAHAGVSVATVVDCKPSEGSRMKKKAAAGARCARGEQTQLYCKASAE